ncbi:MAG: hypothetical protein KJ852_12045 [Gammaproteobacteria bacterium]|nr:hypothetical protein [Gammaproteobacteria bacterium]MBU0813563.1 hypothetical protein [Gammaproteobacteria bacterium]MBU1787681.1 hypothetical protein [Gammaproteobacteria bacterium]
MYADPNAIRVKRVNLSLNAAEMRVIEAISEINNMQPSTFIRELVMEALAKQIHGGNSGNSATEMRATA